MPKVVVCTRFDNMFVEQLVTTKAPRVSKDTNSPTNDEIHVTSQACLPTTVNDVNIGFQQVLAQGDSLPMS
jgi:hypothetical protein